MSYPFPSPAALPPLGATLNLAASLEFDVGRPGVDKAAKLAKAFAIPYDQVIMQTHDFEATWRENDISTPLLDNLVQLYGVMQAPGNTYVVAVIITCEMGEANLYFCTDVATDQMFDPPDYRYFIPVPITAGGCFVYANDHDYEEAATWQTQTDVPIYLGEILAGSFMPTRLTSYVFLHTKGV
jgi:hypothetical protein